MKKIIFILFVNALIIAIGLEIGSYLIYPALLKKEFNKKEIKAKLLPSSVNDDAADLIQPNPVHPYFADCVVHPYLGYVLDSPLEEGKRRDALGFNNEHLTDANNKPASLRSSSEDKLKIVIAGGSLAAQVYLQSGDKLKELLQDSSVFNEGDIIIYKVALGGYKQPQQLMALNYFLSLGIDIDIWINIDGFNDLVLPVAENLPSGTALSYPRIWAFFINKSIDNQSLSLLADIQGVRNQRADLRAGFSGNALTSNSAFFLMLWEVFDRNLAQKEYAYTSELERRASGDARTYEASGPVDKGMPIQTAIKYAVDIWGRASQLMSTICESEGIKYAQFLQPNQYVAGSKVFSQEEKSTAIYDYDGSIERDTPKDLKDAVLIYRYKKVASTGYQYLIEKGKELAASGVDYHDLTMLYKDIEETVYIDNCCHVNQLGSDMIVEKVADVLIAGGKK